MLPPSPSPARHAPSRREVLLGGAALAAVAAVAPRVAAEPERAQPLARRPFGKTGEETTVFGLGCFPLGNLTDEDAAVALVLRALDAGCTYVDTAPSYGSGRSERRVGQALGERPDAKVLVATKTLARTASEARRELEGSLERLGRERVDVVQVHAVTDAADLARVLAPKGPLAGLARAREEGLVRFLGVTGHADPAVMREAALHAPVDAILFPANCVDPHHLSFVKETLPSASERGLARVAMKVFASGGLVQRGIGAESCLRYTYGLDVSVAIVGCRFPEEVDLAVRVAREGRRLEEAEQRRLLESTRHHAGRSLEWYKRQ